MFLIQLGLWIFSMRGLSKTAFANLVTWRFWAFWRLDLTTAFL
jgi:hypothetical protein